MRTLGAWMSQCRRGSYGSGLGHVMDKYWLVYGDYAACDDDSDDDDDEDDDDDANDSCNNDDCNYGSVVVSHMTK